MERSVLVQCEIDRKRSVVVSLVLLVFRPSWKWKSASSVKMTERRRDKEYDVRVAVGISVARYPPHRSPRAVLPHEALILDEWRQSELGGKDVGRAVLGSIAPPVVAFAPSSDNPAGRDGSELAATAESPDCGIRGGHSVLPGTA